MSVSKSFKIITAALVSIACAVALTFLHLQNSLLKQRVIVRRSDQQRAATIKKENRQLEALFDRQNRSAAGAAASARALVEQTRAEIVVLERRAEERHVAKHAQDLRTAEALATNRDPRQGLTRLEYFQDRGQATPSAAFESLVWATMRGDEAAMVKLGSMSNAVREDAKALIARLPPDAQSHWTPPKLAALWFTGALTELPALQITGESREDAENAVVTFRTPRGEDEKIKLKLSPDGWRVAVPSSAISRLEKKLAAVAPTSP
jgi:hypothetical protein